MSNKYSPRLLINICNKYAKTYRHCMFMLGISAFLTILMFALILYNLPEKFTTDNSTNTAVPGKNNSKKKLDEAKDLYMRAATFGEQKAAILEEAGAAVFYRNGAAGETLSEFAVYNAQTAPELKIKAIMKVSGKVAACVDINSIAEGILIAPGMTFMNYGRIISINKNDIDWEWNGIVHKTKM